MKRYDVNVTVARNRDHSVSTRTIKSMGSYGRHHAAMKARDMLRCAGFTVLSISMSEVVS